MSGSFRGVAVAAAIVMSLVVLSGAGGSSVQTPNRGGTVVMPGGPEPACITPAILACAGGPLVTFLDFLPPAVLPGAYELRPDLTWKPELVSRVDVTKRPPFTLTYHIRPEARWSDGVAITANDFAFTYRTLVKYDAQLDALARFPGGAIRSVRALNAKTLRVVLRRSYAAWRRQLFRVVLPRHVLRGEDYPSVWQERIENPRTGEPIGSGPFLLAGWERGKQLTLTRNPRYWGSHRSYLDRIVLRFDVVPSAESFSSGELLAWWGIEPDLVPSLRRLGIRILAGDGPVLDHIAIQLGAGGHRALRKRLVRQALAYGIDREAIVRKLFGESVPGQRVANNTLFLNSSAYYRPNWSSYRYRPAEARRLLVQAGCRRGADGIYVCAGERLSLRFVTRGDVPRRVTTLALARRQLRRAGIEVVPVIASGNVALGQIQASGEWDLLEYAAFYPGLPDEVALGFPCQDPRFSEASTCRRLVRVDVNRANRTLDAGERARVVNRIDALLAGDVALLPLYWHPGLLAVAPGVAGVVFHPLAPFWNAENWWLEP